MRYKELTEARRNPEQNPKISVNQAIKQRLQSGERGTPDNPKLFVSFTQLDKLGINPKSKYDTPLGIYAYPADYVGWCRQQSRQWNLQPNHVRFLTKPDRLDINIIVV
jgi:hypothetical protein